MEQDDIPKLRLKTNWSKGALPLEEQTAHAASWMGTFLDGVVHSIAEDTEEDARRLQATQRREDDEAMSRMRLEQ